MKSKKAERSGNRAGRLVSAKTAENTLKAHQKHEHIAREGGAATGGAVVGALLGMVGGPPSAIIGAVLGAAIGVTAEDALENASAGRRERDKKLDDEIGINGGDLGAPNLKHPPARLGALSAAASGVGGSSRTAAEGPLSPPDED
jgi:general stress protein YciG